MRRGTTPTHTFTIPFDTSMVKTIKVVYAQNDTEIFCKDTEKCNLNGNEVCVTLTQEETLKLDCKQLVQIQIRVLLTDGSAHASDIHLVNVGKCLDSEVLV